MADLVSRSASLTVDLPATPSAWLGHVPLALWLVEQVRPGMLVELGTHYGHSYFSFCAGVMFNGLHTKCFAVDTWQGDEHAGTYGEEIFAQVSERNQKQFHAFSRLLRMTFDKAVTHFADGTVDILHIDGLHTYDAVRHDFETWRPKLSPKGVVLFHDTNVRERDFGVWRLWEELSSIYPNIEFQHSHGLGVLLVGPDQPDALKELVREPEGNEQRLAFKRLIARLGQAYELQAELRAQVAVLGEFHHRLAAALQATAAAGAERDAAREAAREAAKAALREQEHLQSSLEAELRSRDERIEVLQAELSSLVASTSWRITAPLRWVVRGVRRLRGGEPASDRPARASE